MNYSSLEPERRQKSPIENSPSVNQHQRIETENSDQLHSLATLRKTKGSGIGYSQLHYGTPIKDNYLQSASKMKEKSATPNYQKKEKNNNIPGLNKSNTPHIRRNDSDRSSSGTPSKILSGSKMIIIIQK